jgi:hypothetical protein
MAGRESKRRVRGANVIKAKPDFRNFEFEDLIDFENMVQKFIFAYKYTDEEYTETLTEIWKDVTEEKTERLARQAAEALEKEKVITKGLDDERAEKTLNHARKLRNTVFTNLSQKKNEGHEKKLIPKTIKPLGTPKIKR